MSTGERLAWLVMLVAGVAGSSGCNLLGAAAGGAIQRPVNVKAAYRGLEGQTVAVLVSPSRKVANMHPGAAALIARQISLQLAVDVPNVTVLDPRDVISYQEQNPHWVASDYQSLARHLRVTRLVVVDLSEFSLQDRETPTMWRGTVQGNVGVVEAGGERQNDVVFQQVILTRFPDRQIDSRFSGDPEAFYSGMSKGFAEAVSRLFHDHRLSGKIGVTG